MGTLASQAEIGIWVHAPGAILHDPGESSPEKFRDYTIHMYAKFLQYTAFLFGKRLAKPSVMRSNNGNAVPIRSDSCSTMGTASPLEMPPGLTHCTDD